MNRCSGKLHTVYMKKTVFVVDDSPTVLTAVRRALKNDYNVVELSSGAELFLILEKTVPDVILLDAEMPELSGFDVLKSLKDDPELCDIPVIIITGGNKEEYEQKGLTLGAADFILKPFSNTILRLRIENQLKIVTTYVDALREQKKIMKDIKYRDSLLYATSQSAALLLNCVATQTFEGILYHSMRILAEAVGVGRMHVWENYTENDELCARQIYEWSGGATPQKGKGFTRGISYSTALKRWYDLLSENKSVHGFVREFPEGERSKLESHGVVSIIVAPIFIERKLWGFAGFDECENERRFSHEEESVLRSGGLMIANAWMRNEIIKRLRDTSLNLETALVEAHLASKSKSDFLSTMSHEMRTPLTAIIGMTAIANKTDDVEKKNYALGKIEEASTHLLSVINDVLDMAKIEANKLELSPVEFDLKKTLLNAASVINFRIEEKQQSFSLEIDEKIPAVVIGDDKRLSQVLLNMLSNAVKFTDKGGEVSMGVFLKAEKNDVCELQFEVVDNGIGISPEQQEKLFNVFKQADSRISREYGGTGLGLSISKRIVELMGGKIWVESELGKGAKFLFTIKAKRAVDAVALSIDANDEESADYGVTTVKKGEFLGKNLLLAEDVEVNREIFVSLLEETGISIDFAENGIEAVEKVTSSPGKYDIVFMDVQMPRMDGHEAARQIRKLPHAENLPIIALTANVFKDDVEVCIAAGMNDHLGKPLEMDLIFKKLRKYMK